MRFLLKYLKAEYRRRLYTVARQAFFLSAIVAVLFLFAAIWPALNFMFTATFQNAQYDVRVNGPLTEADVKSIKKALDPWKPVYVGVNEGAANSLLVAGRSFNGSQVYYFQPNDFKRVQLTFFSPGLLVKGSINRSDAWGIDEMTANRIGVSVGDKLAFEQVFSDPEGNSKKIRQTGVIRAIYASTSEVHGIVAPLTTDVARSIRISVGEGPVAYSDLFIKAGSGTQQDLLASLNKVPKAKEWLIEPVDQAYENGKARVEQTLNRNIRYTTIWAALLVYGIYILREQFTRIDKRKKGLAILFSLGLSKGRLYQMFALEQLGINLTTAIFGTWLGKYLLQDMMGLYVPRETYFFLTGLIALVILGVLGMTFVQLIYRFNRFDVSKLLATE